MRPVRQRGLPSAARLGALALAAGLAGCGSSIPKSVRLYARNLPQRTAMYAPLNEVFVKTLIRNDASLQCSLDVADEVPEADSAACDCMRAGSVDWRSDCRAWLGEHLPEVAVAASTVSDEHALQSSVEQE